MADSPPSRAPYGLERPTRVTIHTGRDKDRVSRSLLLGKVDPAKKGVYAMRPDEPTVLLVGEELWNAVPKNVAVLRNRTLVEVDRDKVTRLRDRGLQGDGGRSRGRVTSGRSSRPSPWPPIRSRSAPC